MPKGQKTDDENVQDPVNATGGNGKTPSVTGQDAWREAHGDESDNNDHRKTFPHGEPVRRA